MAILINRDDSFYYYFKLRNGVEYEIKVLTFQINMNLHINQMFYREFTPEQVEFYLANPDATVQEVVNCQLIPPYEPPTPDVQKYITQKVKELKEACYASVTIDDLQYAMANSILAGTALSYTGTRYYTTNEAKAIMKQFMDESAHVMTVYSTYKTRIEAAVSIESVDTIYNEAINQLNS